MNEQSIFAEAIHLASSQRQAFLDEACSGAEMRARIDELLQLHEQTNLEVDQPLLDLTSGLKEQRSSQPGDAVGPYRLLEAIGEGGMGLVYMAEQVEPVRRTVALKIIKPGMDSKQVLARFESERQALAMMEHPNIARVLDVGETDSGHPYFVMELVRGIPVTDYCEREQVGVRERLQVFSQICRAVQHAHQKGIIHRDIKPSNVMITLHDGEPVAKMIDFGIAKAIDTRLTNRTLFTNYAQIVGTPLYMSPEQADISGQDVDTRSDIYSLGVLLYELLTGSTPFDEDRLRSVGFDEMRRIIKEEEPPKPSAKVSTLGQQLETVTNRQPATKRQLHEVLRGELDWIAIKALEKNRGRRYQTADALEEDVRCFLADEPVQACPPSRIYRFKKLVRRNKTTVVGLMLFATMLLAGTVVSAAFAVRAREAERKANRASNVARQEAKEATAISQFLENDLLRGGLTAINNPGISLREALDRAATAVDVRTYDDPLVEAKVHLIVGLAYHSINQQSAAKYHLQRACDVRTRHLGETHRDTMQAAFHLTVAKAAYDRAATSTDVERAEAVVGQFEQLLKTQEAVLGSSDPDALSTMGYLATCYGRLGRYEEAEFLFEKANRGFESAVPPRDPRARRCLKQSIGCLRAIGKAEAANELESRYKGQIHAVDVAQYEKAATRVAEVRQLVKQCQNDYGANAPETVKALEQLGDALVESNAGLDAEPVFQTVLAAQVESFGASHAETFRIKRKLGQLYVRLYQLQKGADYLAQTLSDPKVDGTTLQSLRVIANLMKLKQQFAEAADIHGLLAQTQTRLFGETDARTIGSIHDQGLTYAVMEDISGLQGVIEELKTRVGHDKSSTISCESHLGKLYLKSGDAEKAAQFLTELFDRSQRSLGEDKSLTLATGHVLAESLYQLGQKAEAIDLAKDCLAKCESQLGERDLQTMLTLMLLGEWLMDSEQEASLGSEYLERAIDIEPSLVGLRRQRLGWLKRIAEHAEKASASGNPVDTEQHTQLLKRLAELAERWKDAETTEYATTRLKQLSKRD